MYSVQVYSDTSAVNTGHLPAATAFLRLGLDRREGGINLHWNWLEVAGAGWNCPASLRCSLSGTCPVEHIDIGQQIILKKSLGLYECVFLCALTQVIKKFNNKKYIHKFSVG